MEESFLKTKLKEKERPSHPLQCVVPAERASDRFSPELNVLAQIACRVGILPGSECHSLRSSQFPSIPGSRYCHHHLTDEETESATAQGHLADKQWKWTQIQHWLALKCKFSCRQQWLWLAQRSSPNWSKVRKWSQRWLGCCQQGLSPLAPERRKGVSPLFPRNETAEP